MQGTRPGPERTQLPPPQRKQRALPWASGRGGLPSWAPLSCPIHQRRPHSAPCWSQGQPLLLSLWSTISRSPVSLTPAFPTRDSSLRGTRQVWSWCSLTDSGPCSAGGGLAGGTRDILIQEGVGTAAELRTGLREQGAQRIFPRGGSEEAGWPWCCEQELPGTRTLTEEDTEGGDAGPSRASQGGDCTHPGAQGWGWSRAWAPSRDPSGRPATSPCAGRSLIPAVLVLSGAR